MVGWSQHALFTAVAWHPIHEGLFVSGGSDGAVMFWNMGLVYIYLIIYRVGINVRTTYSYSLAVLYQEKTSWYARIWLIKAVVLTASSVWHTGIHDIYGINVWNILVQLYVFYYTALIERLDQWKRPMKEWCGVLPGIQWAIFWQLDQMTTPRKYWHLNVKFQYADWYIVHERQYLRNK